MSQPRVAGTELLDRNTGRVSPPLTIVTIHAPDSRRTVLVSNRAYRSVGTFWHGSAILPGHWPELTCSPCIVPFVGRAVLTLTPISGHADMKAAPV